MYAFKSHTCMGFEYIRYNAMKKTTMDLYAIQCLMQTLYYTEWRDMHRQR